MKHRYYYVQLWIGDHPEPFLEHCVSTKASAIAWGEMWLKDHQGYTDPKIVIANSPMKGLN